MQGLTGTAIVQGKTGARVVQEAVEIGQTEAVQGKVAATPVPVVAALLQAGAAARPGKTAALQVAPAVRGRVAAYPAGAAMVLVEVAAVQEKVVPMAGPAAVAALETVGAMVAGAAARPDRIVVPLAAGPAAAREGAARAPAGAAMVLVAVTADPGKAGTTAALEPLPAVPVVREMVEICRAAALAVPVLAEAVAMPGMTKAELVVKSPVAGQARIEPYLVEETVGAQCARQLPEMQAYLVEKAVATPCARRS